MQHVRTSIKRCLFVLHTLLHCCWQQAKGSRMLPLLTIGGMSRLALALLNKNYWVSVKHAKVEDDVMVLKWTTWFKTEWFIFFLGWLYKPECGWSRLAGLIKHKAYKKFLLWYGKGRLNGWREKPVGGCSSFIKMMMVRSGKFSDACEMYLRYINSTWEWTKMTAQNDLINRFILLLILECKQIHQ